MSVLTVQGQLIHDTIEDVGAVGERLSIAWKSPHFSMQYLGAGVGVSAGKLLRVLTQ